MNRRQWLGAVPVLAFALAAGSAWAGTKGSVDIDVNSATSLAGTEVPAGRYNVSWESSDAGATLVFKSAGKVVAKSAARIEERDAAATYTAVVSRPNGSGKAVAEVRLQGKKTVIVVG